MFLFYLLLNAKNYQAHLIKCSQVTLQVKTIKDPCRINFKELKSKLVHSLIYIFLKWQVHDSPVRVASISEYISIPLQVKVSRFAYYLNM